MTNRKIEYWVIPPESDAEFVAAWRKCSISTRSLTIPIARSCAWTTSRSSYSKKHYLQLQKIGQPQNLVVTES